MIKKRLTNTSDEDSDDDENRAVRSRKKQLNANVLRKILNRSATGFFNSSATHKSHQTSFTHDSVLKFCLKDIIPFRYLNDHIFMGLSSCGNFLISYKRVSCESENNYDFNSGYKYELFFWIYRPHTPLGKYVRNPDLLLSVLLIQLLPVHSQSFRRPRRGRHKMRNNDAVVERSSHLGCSRIE